MLFFSLLDLAKNVISVSVMKIYYSVRKNFKGNFFVYKGESLQQIEQLVQQLCEK